MTFRFNFLSDWWDAIFASYKTTDGKEITKHISEINFEELGDEDLCRLFEYVILQTDSISRRRRTEKSLQDFFNCNLKP